MRTSKHIFLSVFAIVLSSLPAAGSSFDLAPCEMGGAQARCGTYEVWENRDARAGRRISLKVVVLPSRAETPTRDAVVFIAGGPGDSSTRMAFGLADSAIRDERDVLLVDLRGTGGSHPLRCSYQDDPERATRYLADFFPIGDLGPCLEELGKESDLRYYSTPYAVDDLDEVRAALGYEKLNLIGASYGTRAAQVYLRRHPEHVRSVVLDAPVPTGAAMPMTFAIDADHALDSLLADCRSDAGCRARFSDTRAKLDAVLDSLAKNPVIVDVPHPATGKPVPIEMNRLAMAQLIRYMLYIPTWSSRIPLVVDDATRGDFEQAGSMALLISLALSRANEALYVTVTCTEDVPYFEAETGRFLAAGTFLGPVRVDVQKALCELWPRGELPAGYRDPVRSDVPTLIMVGERDPSTPVRWARAIAAGLSNSRIVVVPDGGHDFEGLNGVECLADLEETFIHDASFERLDLSCLSSISHPPFALEREKKESVALSAEELARFVGSYRDEEKGLVLEISLDDGKLFASMAGQRFLLEARDALEFGIPGVAGVRIVFEEKDAAIIALRFFEGAGEGMRLDRKER